MSNIILDTNLLRQYANRLHAVKKRLHNIDLRLDGLYLKVGLLGLYRLIRADLIIGDFKKLDLAQAYLNETANDFEATERKLQAIDPLNFKLAKYTEFNSKFKPQYTIPGLNDGFVPQGIAYDYDDDYIIISGYDENGRESKIIVIDAKTGKLVKCVSTKNYNGHAGGVVYKDGKIFITSDKGIYKISKKELMAAENGDSISCKRYKNVTTQGSYATSDNDTFYTGQFTGKTKLDNGKTINNPLCEAYSIENGKISGKPKYYIATPQQVQGMVVKENGDIVFTTSYGNGVESKIYTYGNIFDSKPIGYKDNIPVYAVSDKNLKDVTTAPPMIEGACSDGEKIYTIFESGANKYKNKSKSKDPTDAIYVYDEH